MIPLLIEKTVYHIDAEFKIIDSEINIYQPLTLMVGQPDKTSIPKIVQNDVNNITQVYFLSSDNSESPIALAEVPMHLAYNYVYINNKIYFVYEGKVEFINNTWCLVYKAR